MLAKPAATKASLFCMTKSVFVTNNGLSDHIGVAQVVPYVTALSNLGHDLEVISVENYVQSELKESCRGNSKRNSSGIRTRPIFRSNHLPKKVDRLLKPFSIYDTLVKSVESLRPDVLHCRSYMPAQAVLCVSSKYQIPYIFDMRGFWIDQRIESGQWNDRDLFWRSVIKYFRSLEEKAIANASSIVVLTTEARHEIFSHAAYNGCDIDVIPCSVNQDVFTFNPSRRDEVRSSLGFNSSDIVLAYLGAASAVYKPEGAYLLHDALKRRGFSPKLLFIGDHNPAEHMAKAKCFGVELLCDELVCRKVSHSDVPLLLNAADLGLSFIIQTYSSKGVSATKVGEYLSCGLPVIASDGVGDIREIILSGQNGWVLKSFSNGDIEECAGAIISGFHSSNKVISESAKPKFDISLAVSNYDSIYKKF